MKFLLCFSLLFVLTALGDPPPRDGNFWQRLHPIQRQMWAGGWMDGLCTGELVAKEVGSCEAYHGKLEKLGGLGADEIKQGLDEFYEADYRNLAIWMQDAALLVARFSRAGMTSRQAAEQIELLRLKYR